MTTSTYWATTADLLLWGRDIVKLASTFLYCMGLRTFPNAHAVCAEYNKSVTSSILKLNLSPSTKEFYHLTLLSVLKGYFSEK